MKDRGEELEGKVLDLLERALALPPNERSAFVASEGADDEQLRTRAQVLLKSIEDAWRHLATGGALILDDLDDEAPLPQRIGAYRVTEKLGEGGMGAVYRAERDVGDFAHVVAIKLVRPGAMSADLIERFEREREILASLSHPNIARLYDGGTSPQGGPFIIMEFIEGAPIDRWADARELSLDARLMIFRQICEAVSFAHQNLVIHRDLSPANVLVTDEGTPKLIDFGIADPQVPNAGEHAAERSSGLSLTPGFAAPERYSGAPTTTVVDIFSLGKLLARLVERCAEDADIVAIIARATAAKPDDRYPTADALAEDIDRYRNGLPVEARAGGRVYAIGKFVSRNRAPVGAAIAALLVLVGAFVATAFAYSNAEQARRSEAARFAQLRSLANYMVFDLNGRLEQVVGNGEARKGLTERAQRYLTSLSLSTNTNPQLRLETALGFLELAQIQGVPARPNFGDHERAKANLDRAEALLHGAGDPRNPDIAAALARLHAYRGHILMHAESKPVQADKEIAEGETVLAAVPARERNWHWYQARSVVRLAQLDATDLALDAQRMAQLSRELRAEIDEWPPAKRKSRAAAFDRAVALNFEADSLAMSDQEADVAHGLALFEKADEAFVDMLKSQPNDPKVLYRRGWNAYYGFGAAQQLGRLDEAQRLLGQARSSVARLLQIEENDESLATFAENLRESQAELHADLGKFDAAVTLQQGIVADRKAVVDTRRTSSTMSDLAYGYAILGSIARKAGRRALACDSWTSAERLMREVAGQGDLRGYVADLRGGVQANLGKCNAGSPVSSFGPLS